MKKFFLIVPICLLSIIFVCYVGLKYSSYSKYKHEREYELKKMDSINRYKKELDSLKALEKELKAINEEYKSHMRYECEYTPEEIESMHGGRIKLSSKSHIHKEHKQVLIIVGDSTDCNECNLLCNRFAEGAKEVGGEVEIVYLCDYGIPYYYSGDIYRENYSQLDESIDSDGIIDKMIKADIIVFEETISPVGVEWSSGGRLGYLRHRYKNSGLEIRDKEFFYLTMSQRKDGLSLILFNCRSFAENSINAIERGYANNHEQAYKLGKSI